MSKAPIAILDEGLETHPALVTWETFRSRREPARRIEVLRQHGVNAVYRLVGVATDSGTVIAKRMPQAKAHTERTLYERVLPHVPMTVPRYYGALAGPEADTWLFLEDVGSARYVDTNPDHRALTGRWVARFHDTARAVAPAGELPDGGPGRYHRHLVSAAERLQQRLSGPDLSDADLTLMRGIADQVRGLAARWTDIAALCDGFPATVVHGDFRPKNVYLRPADGVEGLACYPIDWETAGWGVPAADLTRIDVAAYWEVAREWCGGLTLDRVCRLAQVGQVFRTIAAIDWECASLRFDARNQIIRSLASLAVLTPRLTDAVQTTGVAA